MVVRRFGILWRPLAYHSSKVPTIFRVMCKLLNMCMDRWMIYNPTAAHLSNFTADDGIPFCADCHLWDTLDICVGLDDVFEQPTYEAVIQRLQDRYHKLGDRCRMYAVQNIPLSDMLTEELYALGIWFNKQLGIY